MIRIYKIQFADRAYIGQTRRSIAQRLSAHKHQPVNTDLHARLTANQPHTISVLSSHRKQRCANAAEARAIARQDNPINVTRHLGMQPAKGVQAPGMHPPFHYRKSPRVRDYPRDESRVQVCRHCNRRLTAEHYWSDRSRSSGLASACRDCGTRIQIAIQRARSRAASVSAAYQQTRDQIRSEATA